MKRIITLISVFFFMCMTAVPAHAKAKKCSDFSTHAKAQAYYKSLKRAKKTGWKNMDRNGDGVACESLIKNKKTTKPKKNTNKTYTSKKNSNTKSTQSKKDKKTKTNKSTKKSEKKSLKKTKDKKTKSTKKKK